MRQHDALGARGGTRGEDDLGRVVRGQLATRGKPHGRPRPQGREVAQQRVGRERRAGLGRALHVVLVHARDQEPFGKPPACIAQLGVEPQELRLYDRARGLRALQHVGGLLGAVLVVHGHHDRTDLGQAEQRDHELGARAQLHRHALAALHTERQEHVGRTVDLLVEGAVRVGARLVGAVAEPQKRALAAGGHEAVPQAAHRFVPHDVRHSPHLFLLRFPGYPLDAAMRGDPPDEGGIERMRGVDAGRASAEPAAPGCSSRNGGTP